MKGIFITTIILIFVHSNFYGQGTSLVNKVSFEETSIQLKWYNEKLTSSSGVDVYRKEEFGDWQKITKKKVKRGNPEYLSLIKSDTNCYELALDLKNNWNPKGLMLLNVLVKSFENNDLAKYLGIYYKDSTVVKGKKYFYKVVDFNGTKIVESEVVSVSENEFEPPKEFSLSKKKKEVRINWLPEETRYYAVNIYRKDSISEYRQINRLPILPSKTGKEEYPKFFYLDEKIKEGVKYTYALKAIDFFGEESKKSNELQILIPDETPPIAPTNLRKVDVIKQEVTIAWKNPDYKGDAEGVNIYRSLYSKGPFTKVNNSLLPISDTLYVDIAPESKDYYYHVSSIDKSGNEAPSTKIIVNVEDIIAPSTPIGLVAISDTGKINLNWSSNTEKDLKGYLIYRTILRADSSKYTLLNSTPLIDTFFIDNRPKRAKNKFAYSIVAIDSAFNMSHYSKPVLLKMPDVIPPETPVIKNGISKDGKIIVEWIKNVDLDLKNYIIYRKSEKVEAYLEVGISTNLFFEDKNIKSDSVYLYKIKAIDSNSNLSAFSNVFKIRSNKALIYNQTLIVKSKLKNNGKTVKLNWKKNKINENCKGYVVFYNDKNNARLKSKLMKENKFILQNYSGTSIIIKAYMNNGEIISSEKVITDG